MGENVESKPLGTRIAYAFGLAIGIGVMHVKKAYESLRYSVGFLGHLARNRQRYMIEYDKFTSEENIVKETLEALRRQTVPTNERPAIKSNATLLKETSNPLDFKYDDKAMLDKDTATIIANTILANQKAYHPDSIDKSKEFLSSSEPIRTTVDGKEVDSFWPKDVDLSKLKDNTLTTPLPGSKDSLVAAAKKVMETSVKH
jgi:hypothetical protein